MSAANPRDGGSESPGPVWFRRDLTLGDEGDDVLIVQRKLDAPVTGTYDEDTAARVRGLQKAMGRKPQSGVVDAAVADRLGPKPTEGQVPEWFEQDCSAGCACPAVVHIRILLGQPNLPVDFDQPLEDAVRRYQSENGLPLTGVVDERMAVLLTDRAA